jgi:hypothetical protein
MVSKLREMSKEVLHLVPDLLVVRQSWCILVIPLLLLLLLLLLLSLPPPGSVPVSSDGAEQSGAAHSGAALHGQTEG